MRELLKEWRFWLFAIAVVLAVLSIGYSPGKAGVVVTSITSDSPLAGTVGIGDTIQSINEEELRSPEDLEKWEDFRGVLRVVHDGPPALIDKESAGLGIEVEGRSATNLDLGMDLVGGTRVLLEPQYPEGVSEEEQDRLAEQVVTTLQTRINVYGLQEMPIRPVEDVSGKTFVQIESTSASLSAIDEVLQRQGEFEAFVPRPVPLNDRGEGILELGAGNYTINREGNGTIRFNGSTHSVNETLQIGGIPFQVRNVSASRVDIWARVFDSDDITSVSTAGRQAYVQQSGTDSYRFRFPILIADEGTERFAAVTEDLQCLGRGTVRGGGRDYLSQQIHLFLDEVPVSQLNIGCGLQGSATNRHVISGGAQTREMAEQEMKQLQTVMESGSLPVELEKARVDTISPTLGREFLSSVMIAGVLALAAVTLVVFTRYRRLDIVGPMAFVTTAEVTMLLGVAAAINWTIDLAAIAGVIAAIGTSIDDQIVIADEALREEKRRTSDRIKRAFFVVFGTAATTISAMVPLAFIGIGVMRGFAVITIIGILIGISISRAFYAKLIEYLVD